MRLTFGKHKGEDTADVPVSYLRWLEEQDWIGEELREECQYRIGLADGNRPGAGKKLSRY